MKKYSNIEITGSLTVVGPITGSFTGSFTGDGSGLTMMDIPAGVYEYTGSSNNSIVPLSGSNISTGFFATVGGGASSNTNARYSTIAGGHANIVKSITNECCARGATISGGIGHNTGLGTLDPNTGCLTGFTCCNAGAFSTIGGGLRNCAEGLGATISGGWCSTVAPTGTFATVGGGISNCASNNRSTVGGGAVNTASGYASTVGGGRCNTASGCCSTIAGGNSNCISVCNSTIAGGVFNTASGISSTVGGGRQNTASNQYSTIAGGQCNTASGCCSTIAGGRNNTASAPFSTVGGGFNNTASGDNSGILGGTSNNTCNFANAFIVGSGLCATAACTTFVNNLCNLNSPTSDCRLKENINPIPYGLKELTKLEPVSYNFKSDESKAIKYGFLAQKIQEVMPDLIKYHPTDLVDGDKVLQFEKEAVWASMVNAIKELKNRVELLESKLN